MNFFLQATVFRVDSLFRSHFFTHKLTDSRTHSQNFKFSMLDPTVINFKHSKNIYQWHQPLPCLYLNHTLHNTTLLHHTYSQHTLSYHLILRPCSRRYFGFRGSAQGLEHHFRTKGMVFHIQIPL